MKKYKLPAGMQDYIFDEFEFKEKIESMTMELFKRYGYEQAETPSLEYYEIYSKGIGAVDLKHLFKVSDTDGSLLVLRPDITMPLARIISTKYKGPFPCKLCYLGNSFALSGDDYRYREFTQAGVELFGEKGAEADAEVITLAIECLLHAGLKDFQIDIGHAGFFKSFLASFHLTREEENEITALMDQKNMFAIELLAREKNIPESKIQPLLKLPFLFGGEEVFVEAEKLCVSEESRAALNNLKAIYSLLVETGYGQYISFDLSLVNSLNYYTGAVFKGITKSFGSPVLGGGRYDTLTGDFGKTIPATGFGLGIKHLLIALERNQSAEMGYKFDEVVGCAQGEEASCAAYVKEKAQTGERAVNTFLHDKKQLLEYARAKRAKKAVFLDKNGREEL